jgi:hypothetical protein
VVSLNWGMKKDKSYKFKASGFGLQASIQYPAVLISSKISYDDSCCQFRFLFRNSLLQARLLTAHPSAAKGRRHNFVSRVKTSIWDWRWQGIKDGAGKISKFCLLYHFKNG